MDNKRETRGELIRTSKAGFNCEYYEKLREYGLNNVADTYLEEMERVAN